MAEKKKKENSWEDTKKAYQANLELQTKLVKEFGFTSSGKTRIGNLSNKMQAR